MSRIAAFVFRSDTLERTAAFYRALGLTLTPERHDRGPRHYSMEVGHGVVVELYPKPRQMTYAPTGTLDVQLIIEVDDIESVRRILHNDGFLLAPFTDFSVHRTYKTRDPDGRVIVLTDNGPASPAP